MNLEEHEICGQLQGNAHTEQPNNLFANNVCWKFLNEIQLMSAKVSLRLTH